MKRDFLESLDLGEGERLSDAAIDAIMGEHGKTTGSLRSTIDSLTKERDGLQTKLDGLADYNDIKSQRDALQKEINTRNVREKVSADSGVPAHLLTGETEESCKAQAEAILKWKGPQKNYPDVPDGGDPGHFAGGKTRDQFAEWFKAELNKT